MAIPNMLWCKALRSPIAHGRIKDINFSNAQAVPGVKVVLTGAAVSGARIGKKIIDMPLLADGVVRYIGEKVAVVAADTEAAATRAISLIEVKYEERSCQTVGSFDTPGRRDLPRTTPSN